MEWAKLDKLLSIAVIHVGDYVIMHGDIRCAQTLEMSMFII